MNPFTTLSANAAAIHSRIEAACLRAGRNAAEIQLIWVSKNHPQARLVEAHAAGARLFGENRVQEVLEKFPLPAMNPLTGQPQDHELHFIGHLQSNKVRKVLPLCSTIHSIDSAELWQAVGRIAGELDLKRDVFIQVNVSREPQKSGFNPEGLLEALAGLSPAPNLRFMGLMAMGPMEGGAEAARPCFREMRSLIQSLANHSFLRRRFPEAKCLSMGMSGDFEVAVEEGAHFLRIGAALFEGR